MSRLAAAKLLVEVSIKKAGDSSFSRILNTASVNILEMKKGSVSFEYNVPPNICVKSKGNASMSCSSTLALFDELSTYCFMMSDRTCRPGVSVHLNTELLQDVAPGEKVTIITTSDKIGKTLGFCTMKMFNESGELVSRGKHIKYLPMGPVWDIMFHPTLAPVTMQFMELVLNKWSRSFVGKHISQVIMGGRNKSIAPERLNESLGGAFQMLGLEKIASTTIVENDDEGSNKTRIDAGTTHIHTCPQYSYGLTVKPILNNLIGRFHGGAIAMSIEHSLSSSSKFNATTNASATASPSTSNSNSTPNQPVENSASIRSMDIHYLSSLVGNLTVVCHDDNLSQFVPKVPRSIGNIQNAKGNIGVEFSCTWK